MKVFAVLGRFNRSENGATAVEYGLIAAGIAVVLISSLTIIGTEVNETFTVVGNTLSTTQ